MRSTRVLRAICLLLMSMFMLAPASRSSSEIVRRRPVSALTTAEAQTRLQSIVNAKSWSADQKLSVMQAYNKLPNGMKLSLVQYYADKASLIQPDNKLTPVRRIDPDKIRLLLPSITDVWPDSGDACTGFMILVHGNGLNENCALMLNGNAQPTNYFPWPDDDGPVVGCPVPQVPLGVDYSLTVKDTSTSKVSNAVTYRIVAPRGFRGNQGWRFGNFGEPSPPGIPWDVFRHYFGAAAVEDAYGHHLPSAQSWYDSTYKGVGAGGNCFGMTTRAQRFFYGNNWGLYETYWNGNHKPRAWDYDFINEVHRSVNEDQAAQLCAETSYWLNYYWNHQTHNQAWERCRDLLNSTNDQPVMCVWGPGWGHCIWPYEVVDGNSTRQIIVYDNNVPYREAETSNTTKVATISRSSGAFAWGSGNKCVMLDYNEATPAHPHLPGGVGASTGTNSVSAVVVDTPTGAAQITDQQGHTFYSGTQENRNEATRIPDSMRFIPVTGTTPDPSFPAVYLFNNPQGKSFTVTSKTPGQTIRTFAPGAVFEVEPKAGQAQVTFDKLGTDQAGVVMRRGGNNPRVRSIIIIGGRNERVFEVNFATPVDGVTVRPKADHSGITIENRGGADLKYDLRIQHFLNGAVQSSRLAVQDLPKSSVAALAPANWAQIGDVQLDLRNLSSGAVIRRQTLRGQ